MCNFWFGRFKLGNFDLKDRSRSGRPEEVDNDVLEDLIPVDPRLSSVELFAILGFHQTTICDHLKSIGNVSKAEILVHTSCHQKVSYRELQFVRHCSLGNNRNRFSSVLLPQMRNGFCMSMLSLEDNGWTKAKPPYRRQNLASTRRKFSFVFGGIAKVWSTLNCWIRIRQSLLICIANNWIA